MLAFHNDSAIKEKYLSRVRAHRLADEIHKGEYFNEEKRRFCAIGCTIHGDDHSKYEIELGIPSILARLEDGIFENLPNDRAKNWPAEFLTAINVGADLFAVWPKFAVWLLIDEKYGVFQYAKSDKSKKSIQLIADYYNRYTAITITEWRSAYAYAAADAYAAAAADAAAYANAAAYVAYAAAAADAADAADAAAYAAAANAAAAYAAAANAAAYTAAGAAYAAKIKIRIAQADKLLELLRECK